MVQGATQTTQTCFATHMHDVRLELPRMLLRVQLSGCGLASICMKS